MSEVLNQIVKISKNLNQQADAAMQKIQEVDKELSEAQIGLELWMKNSFYEVRGVTYLHPSTKISECAWNKYYLGFTKIKTTWCIAVNIITYVGTGEHPIRAKQRIHPLLKCGRMVRIKSINHISALCSLILDTLNTQQTEATKLLEKY
jgi:hypothetical protein